MKRVKQNVCPCPFYFGSQQGRSQTFRTDEASVPSARGVSFQGVWGHASAPPEHFSNLLSPKCYFQHFSMRFFFKIQYRARCKTAIF